MKGLFYLLLLSPSIIQGAFESIDCGQEDIFENPSYISEQIIQTMWVQSFGILPYTKVSWTGLKHIGIGASNFGNELYRENELLVRYVCENRKAKIGGSVRGMSLWAKDRETNFAIGIDAGMTFCAIPLVDFTVAVQNVNFPNISGDAIPKRVIIGVSVKPRPEFTTYLQVYKESVYPVEIRLRSEIEISELMSIGIGVKTYPSAFTFEVLLNHKRLGISYFARTHETLGLTHSFGVKIKK
ncbi:MAG: hypothetical protein HY769_07015 [Candidatus Stahlbacteria bacterium]|nr:hypothetical protein [Candidatus Stahlbacteria bacterium]